MKKVLVVILCVGFLLPALNCATILDGAKKPHERTSDIQWGYVILDLLTTGFLGIIIDFADGAIYKSTSSSSEIEQDLNKYTSQGIPCYKLRDNGLYKVELVAGQLKESKIEQNAIPPVVWQAIEKEKSLRMVSAPQFAQ
jgi:hypothetical protein